MDNFQDGGAGGSGSELARTAAPAATDMRQAETNHRIANSVQFAAALLRHESRQITSVESARTALVNAVGRLNAIAHMHRQLTRTLPDQKVNLAQFLAPFCEDISQAIGVSLDVRSEGLTLRADVAAQICIILNELAMNAVKHGHLDGEPVHLSMNTARRPDNGLRLTVRDNGAGLPEGFALDHTHGLGMTIITSTVEKLGGTIRTVDGDGAGFRIDLPPH